MPVVDVDPDELRTLTGHDEKDDDELIEDLFALGLEFEGRTEDGELELEFAPDRLDRLSVEGVARSLRYQYGDDRGVYVPSTNDPDWTIEVDADVPDERPCVTGAVIRDVNLDEAALESLIQLQEKLHATMGRNRRKGAIGIHDLTMLKGESLEEVASDDDGEAAPTDPTVGDDTAPTDPTADDGTAPTDPSVEDGPRPGDGSRPSVDDAGPADRTTKSIRYTGVAPDGDRFVPLDSDAELTPGEVLEEHATGQEYADLVADYGRMPAIYDSIGLFSFPPVINGRRTEVSTESRDLFVEMTGTDQWTIDRMLAIVCYALDARGATIEEVAIEYEEPPDEDVPAELLRPDLDVREKTVAHDRIETILGIDLDPDEVLDLAERSGLDATRREADSGLVYGVEIPPYRVDVLHPIDLIDDLGRAYGFNTLDPRYPDVSTVGKRHERSRIEEAARETLVGLGFEDALTFHMTNEAENFERMGLPIPEAASIDLQADELELAGYRGEHAPGQDGDSGVLEDSLGLKVPPTIKEPYSEDFTILRTWVLPSLLMMLEGNTHREYPQELGEVGFVAGVDPTEPTGVREHRSVTGAIARHDASYEDARGALQTIARAFGVNLETPPTEHPSFVEGRVADVVLDGEIAGVVGEVHPEVLVEHDLEVPVAAFEVELDALH